MSDIEVTWHEVNNDVDGRVYAGLWCKVAESFYQERNRDYWAAVAERVGGRVWEPFSQSTEVP